MKSNISSHQLSMFDSNPADLNNSDGIECAIAASIESAIAAIHEGTAIYTSAPEIEKLLDLLTWPAGGGRLLDPACGDGNMLVAALARLKPTPGNFQEAQRVHGIEFHHESVLEARERCALVLTNNGWDETEALACAETLVIQRDFLLDEIDQTWDVILANPPYWRRARLPGSYRDAFDEVTPHHARGDLLNAYLDKMPAVLAEGGQMALVTSDRWLANAGTGRLREALGDRFCVSHVERLDTASAFHRPKKREKDTPPRVHAVGMILSNEGRSIDASPFVVDEIPEVDGVPLEEIVTIRLAPWLGPDGIFLLDSPDAVPGAKTVPCVMPRGIDSETGEIGKPIRWAIVTGDEPPPPSVARHLEREMARMPKRGRREATPWIPPERFDKHLPLAEDAILIPRIATSLRPIRLPAGRLPVNHSLVLISGMSWEDVSTMLSHPLVQAQADALAPRVESGYRSYTATLLRQLVIPHEAIPVALKKAA